MVQIELCISEALLGQKLVVQMHSVAPENDHENCKSRTSFGLSNDMALNEESTVSAIVENK